MVKFYKLLFLVTILLCFKVLSAQESSPRTLSEVTVYEGTETNDVIPMYVYYYDAYTKSQYIIPSNSLNLPEGSFIQAIKYYTTTNNIPYTPNVQIDLYMTEVDYTSISEYIDKSDATVVYTGYVDFVLESDHGETTITFDTPYLYNGGNLLIGCENKEQGGYKGIKYFGQDVDGASIGYYNYDNQTYFSVESQNFIPQTTLYYEEGATEPNIVTIPETLEMGMHPNVASPAPYQVVLRNKGTETAINSITVNNEYFQLDLSGLTFPITLGRNETAAFNITTATATGEQNGTVTVACSNDLTFTYPIHAIAYNPAAGDVWETAIEVTDFPFTANLNSTSIPLYNNYCLNPTDIADGADVVYVMTFDKWTSIGASVTAGENGKVALFNEDFDEVGGPYITNQINSGYGGFTEGFESGDFNTALNWTNPADDGYYGFEVTTAEAFSGIYSMKSTNANQNSTTAAIDLTVNLSGDGVVGFNWKIFSESCYDVGHFYIDYEQQGDDLCDPGDIIYWQYSEFPISAGEHTLTWTYSKDDGDSANTDCIYIDNITIAEGGKMSDMIVPPGTYYLVASSTSDEWSLKIDVEDASCPERAYNPEPSNGYSVYQDNNIEIGWDFDVRTTEYKLVFGTTEDCETTLVDWTSELTNHYTLPILENDVTYYWQVIERNGDCSEVVASPVWSFTPIIYTPYSFSLSKSRMFEGESLTLYWYLYSNNVLSFNIYKDDVLFANTPAQSNSSSQSYTIQDLTYNVNPGYSFSVSAVYVSGESNTTSSRTVQVSGYGTVEGYVYEQDGVTPIANAKVSVGITNDFNSNYGYAVYTDTNGHYSINMYTGSGNYANATKTGYQTSNYESSFTVACNASTNIDFILDETFAPVASVQYEEGDGYVNLTWTGNRSLSYYRLFRTSADNSGPYTTDNTELIADNIVETSYTDNSWASVEVGTYKYGVSCVYAGNRDDLQGERESEITWSSSIEKDLSIFHTTALVEDWNWWSTYIELNNVDGLQMLETTLGNDGQIISSQADGYTYFYGQQYGWYGSLTSINNEKMYKIKTTAATSASMRGYVADASEHPITVVPGWTYIGFIRDEQVAVSEALADLTASEGDIIKSQEAFSTYYGEYGWYGSLNNLEPGKGYLYLSNNSENSTFTYPVSSKADFDENMTSENNHWVANVKGYPSNMTVIAVVELDGVEISSDDYELAVFANNECRGSVRLMWVEPMQRYAAMLTVAGEEVEDLYFGLYNATTGDVTYDAGQSLTFSSDAVIGTGKTPLVVSFRGMDGMEELGNAIKAYPNPVNRGEELRIDMPGYDKQVSVEVVNTLGTVVMSSRMSGSQHTIIVPETPGVYTLRIVASDNVVVCRKLIVK